MINQWNSTTVEPEINQKILCFWKNGDTEVTTTEWYTGYFKLRNKGYEFNHPTCLGWMPMPYEKQQPEKELNMEAKWYGKDVKPEIGQKVIAYFKDGSACHFLVGSTMDNSDIVAWTPLPKSKEEMEKEQLKQMIESTRDQLDNFLHTAFLSTGDLSRSFLNEVSDLLKRLS